MASGLDRKSLSRVEPVWMALLMSVPVMRVMKKEEKLLTLVKGR